MHPPIAPSKRAPFEGVPPETFQEFAVFLRRAAPRWLNGSRSLSRLMARRAGQRQPTRGRCRGVRHVGAPAHLVKADLRRRR